VSWRNPDRSQGSRSCTAAELLPAAAVAAIGRVRDGGDAELLDLDQPRPPGNGPAHERPAFEARVALVLPLRARARVLGVLTLCFGPSQRHFGLTERALAEELADRGAIALDNALLFGEREEADRRKDEFLAMLSHELRNPLAPILNAAAVIGQLPLDAVVRQQRDVIDRQARQMKRLLDDLLEISRITSGKVRFQRDRIDLGEAISQAIEMAMPMLEARKHTLTVAIPDGSTATAPACRRSPPTSSTTPPSSPGKAARSRWPSSAATATCRCASPTPGSG
jgi:signal transduction histidine kinase